MERLYLVFGKNCEYMHIFHATHTLYRQFLKCEVVSEIPLNKQFLEKKLIIIMPIKNPSPKNFMYQTQILYYPLILRHMQAFDNLLIKSFSFFPFGGI
jgi:hypothetical protein